MMELTMSEQEKTVISVIIPSYNKISFIKETLFSVDRQITKAKFLIEIIIIDDNSNDGTREFVNSYTWTNPEIVRTEVINHPLNCGVSKSYIDGLNSAKGEYIVLLDADDILTRYSLLSRLRALKENCEKEWVTGQQLVMTETGQLVVGKEFNKKVEPKNKSDFLKYHLNGSLHIPASSIMIKNETLRRVNWIEEMKSSQDFALILQLAIEGITPIFLDSYVAFYRYHSDTSSHSLYRRSIRNGQKIDDFKILYEKTAKNLNQEERELLKDWIKRWEDEYAEVNNS